ncbi:hypothetical protein EV426DRAFT_720667 [Tirmania nivea]|nr:hypothetical protein EV426DRAFT_720667 [Tirmania nivea]
MGAPPSFRNSSPYLADDNDDDQGSDNEGSVSSISTISSASTRSEEGESLDSEMGEMDEELETELVLGLLELEAMRYLEPKTPGIPKDLVFFDDILPQLPTDRFQQFFRMGVLLLVGKRHIRGKRHGWISLFAKTTPPPPGPISPISVHETTQ